MDEWKVDDFEHDFEGVQEIDVAIAAGDVAITAADGPVHLEARVLDGEPLKVVHDGDRLSVSHTLFDEDLDFSFSDLGGIVDAAVSLARKATRGGLKVSLGRRMRASVLVTVPPETRVRIKTASASALVSRTDGAIDITSLSGDATLDRLDGDVTVRSVSGSIESLGLGGAARLTSTSGDITVARAACESITAQTVSGDVTVDTDLAPAGRYEVRSVSGDVLLRIPADAGADIEISHVSGRVESDIELEGDRERPYGRKMRATVGDGSARVRVKTVSGDVTVMRREPAGAAATAPDGDADDGDSDGDDADGDDA